MPKQVDAKGKKAREKLRRYERLLKAEKAKYGCYNDGAGKRYHIGPLYLLLGDLEGAIRSFAWFDIEFPDDSGEVFTYIAWSLALYRSAGAVGATSKLRAAMLLRPTVFARVIGESWTDLSVDRTMDDLDADEAEFILEEYGTLWSAAELQWMRELYSGSDFTSVRTRHVEIERLLKHEPRGALRTQLVDELYSLGRRAGPSGT